MIPITVSMNISIQHVFSLSGMVEDIPVQLEIHPVEDAGMIKY
tara:strand:+ start:4495 stop:4623 length:129 start_codon:yes stop_codon:yes gene_type:complete